MVLSPTLSPSPSGKNMIPSLEDSSSGKLLKLLCASPLPLSTKELGVRLRLRHVRLQDYEVGCILRNLLNEGKVNFRMGRWTTVPSPEAAKAILSPSAFPLLSNETLSILAPKTHTYSSEITHSEKEIGTEIDQPGINLYSGRWGTFRKLVAYYRQCVRQEEGADASAFQNELGKNFLYLRKIGRWYPRPGIRWQTIIPLGSHLSPLLNALPGKNEDQDLVVGYPVQAYFKEKEDEPSVAVIRPIFFFTVAASIAQSGLLISSEDPRPEINLGWLEFAFSRNLDRQRSFLSACGFLNRGLQIDEPPGLEKGELIPSLSTLVAALSAFMPEKVREPLQIESVPEDPLRTPFLNGIYNRAVVMLAKRTKYTGTLLKELAAIEGASDEMLEQTALRHFFLSDREQVRSGGLLHERVVADVTPLNGEQRQAVASLLLRDVSVITGPPGAGKTQVVSSTIANARLGGQTVLFSSRNHKAIDAVINHPSCPEGRPLIVRTNSKDDPNLNYTFSHAIRDMLAAQPQPEARERLERAHEELTALLEERGRNATLASKVAEAGASLGEIEERKSFLARDLAEDMASFLDAKPELFPLRAVQKVIRKTHALHLRLIDDSFINKLLVSLSIWTILPWYRFARRSLRMIPGSPKLPALLGPSSLKGLLPKLSELERASEYARLQTNCKPFEHILSELPQLEFLATTVSDLSHRIQEVSLRAVPFDLDSRSNLEQGLNREQLDGLRAALNAMRTGLDETVIRQETIRVIEERAPQILKAFPCWAVTNLSAGSRIPLVPGLFDLAVVDEASQSDIPSAIPILFRARRAAVVGDPLQLSYVSRLTTARDTLLRRQVGLKRVEDVRFAYTASSLYDLFAGTNGVEPVFLSETYRSVADIANYSSRTFYGGRLRVATNETRLIRPQGMAKGIHWTEVKGEIQSGGGSGCTCREEIDAVLHSMRTLLLENNFLGTVGVVTPFRQQANRLKDALFESDSQLYDALVRSEVNVDTAHGFQGDQRDVMVFSLCAGPDMPAGSLSFLRETGNLFNVAASRARAVLHVVGNREWARKCGIRHIEQLATLQKSQPGTPQQGPWHPHESPWEEKLYRALLKNGLEPRAQFPVSWRRLDLALVREGDWTIKIDIEVDGDCHRNPDGTRKMDDLWRDIQLQGMGWKVMRFWTYRLREEMSACVEDIMKAWRKHE
ncbi:MAG: AAA domain-containing protein [Syntrophobacteraceae bacterium]